MNEQTVVTYTAEEKERAREMAQAEWGQACHDFDVRWSGEHDNCGGWTTSGPPCGGCYECCLAQALHGMPNWADYLQRARMELANESFGTTCVDCGRAIGDEDETVPDEDGNLLHVGCGEPDEGYPGFDHEFGAR